MRQGLRLPRRVIDWHSRRVLSWRVSITLMTASASRPSRSDAAFRHPGDLQHRSGQPVHQQRLHRTAQEARHPDQHGRQGLLARQRLRRTALASVKYEEVYLKAYDSVSIAKASLGTYLNFYNTRRPHQSLDGNTPDAIYFAGLPQESIAA
jgi:putative transposase